MHKPRSTPKLASLPARRHHETMELLRLIHSHQHTIIERMHHMSTETTAALARLTASVEANATVDASILALVEGLAQQIRDNAGDPTALNALADKLDADQAKIAAAVVANTPPTP